MKIAETTDGARPALVLFRNDLRLADNRALSAAAASGRPVICAFVFDTSGEIRRPVGAARHWWLHKSLEALDASLSKAGASLVLRQGPAQAEVRKLIRETGAGAVFWNRHYEPLSVAFDTKLKSDLRGEGIEAESFEGELLHEPTQVKTGTGGHFRVYSPFWRALEAGQEPRDPLPAPTSLKSWTGHVDSVSLESLDLLPTKPDWAGGLRETWTPGEAGAQARLDDFLSEIVKGYAEGRDRSRISTAPRACRRILPMARSRRSRSSLPCARPRGPGRARDRREISQGGRLARILLPPPVPQSGACDAQLQRRLRRVSLGPAMTRCCAPGSGASTGYPIVDAGMRQLWQTGWMHNRVRMIVASFLVKHLLIDWRDGEAWFWDTLVDADSGQQRRRAGSGWQAPAPTPRPISASSIRCCRARSSTRTAAYVRRFVPELAKLPSTPHPHALGSARWRCLPEAGVKLGTNYPVPVVKHQTARDRAMACLRDYARGPMTIAKFQRSDGSRRRRVAVVGSGISGASAAWALHRQLRRDALRGGGRARRPYRDRRRRL